jgi:hypothetical protein
VAAKHGTAERAERTAVVAVRYGEVTIKRPRHAETSLPPTLTLHVVDVREVDPPKDPKQRVHWCLLSTHTVSTPEEAMQVVGWYRLRWTIEQVFRTMKTDGVDVETSQITTPGSLLKLVVIALIAAIRVMQLVIGRDGSTGQKLTDVADPIELPALQAISASLEGEDRETAQPVRPQHAGLVRLDRRPARRMVRLHIEGIQAGGPPNHGPRTQTPRSYGRRVEAANHSALVGLS